MSLFRSKVPLWTCLCFTHSLPQSRVYRFPNLVCNSTIMLSIENVHRIQYIALTFWHIILLIHFLHQMTQSFIREMFLCYIEDFLYFLSVDSFVWWSVCLFVCSPIWHCFAPMDSLSLCCWQRPCSQLTFKAFVSWSYDP